jgi:hypothetical protein
MSILKHVKIFLIGIIAFIFLILVATTLSVMFHYFWWLIIPIIIYLVGYIVYDISQV